MKLNHKTFWIFIRSQLPTKESSTLLPVIFYVFGGKFQNGNTTVLELNPDFLLDKDVILVIPNFRLGVLAWLSTGDEVSPGNYGLKDIVRALEWNRDNIKYFGGDPERVTLVGSSSGSMTVSLLLMSDSTEGKIWPSMSGKSRSSDSYFRNFFRPLLCIDDEIFAQDFFIAS